MEENHAQYECFICFEISNQYEKHPSRLNNLQDYIKNCSCDGWIHNICIKKWYKSNETCPICRKKIVFLNFDLQYGIYIIHYFVVTTNSVYVFVQHLIKLRNFIIFCIILTNIMNIVSIALHNFHKNDMCSDNMYEYNRHYYYSEYVYDADQIL
jgi:hypothetical protein